MKILIFALIFVWILVIPVQAMNISPPPVPDAGFAYMPENTESFSDGLWQTLKLAVQHLHPAFTHAASVCLSVIVIVILVSILDSGGGDISSFTNLSGTVMIGILLLSPTHTLIRMGTDTVHALHEYGKLLLPVMTAALAAQGGITSSAVLYTGTAMFCTLLTTVIVHLVVPMLYIYLCLCISGSALGDKMLKRMQDFIKWLMTWTLKILLYVFTGYLTISGVISGTADASAIKAAKLTISGAVPVIGGILSDASETILVSAGVLKNSAGIYGLLAIIALWIGPFLQIACQYLLTKLTGAICGVIGSKPTASLVENTAGAMGIILAMTGTVCLLLLVSTVCFMKGIG